MGKYRSDVDGIFHPRLRISSCRIYGKISQKSSESVSVTFDVAIDDEQAAGTEEEKEAVEGEERERE